MGLRTILRKYGVIKGRLSFEVQLADHCNLNCVGCSHFSQIADEHFLDVESYRRDCERLAELAGKYVHYVKLMGGEPLLHKKIDKILEITRKNFKKANIDLITNGILLHHMTDDFWNACKKNNITIAITPYPINLNVKKNCELALRHGVNITSFGGVQYKMMFRKDVYDLSGTQDINKSFKKCGKKWCHHLYEGKFYICPIPAYIKYFNQRFSKNLEVSTKDYIDIYDEKNAKELHKYLNKSIPFCRYCNINAAKRDIVWGVSKKEISEYT